MVCNMPITLRLGCKFAVDDFFYGHGQSKARGSDTSYGTTVETSRIMYGQTRARKKVVIFLSVFLLSGFCSEYSIK